MQPINDNVIGELKVAGLPEAVCFTTFEEMINALPQYLQVQVPASVKGVVVSTQEPNEDQRDLLWIRRDPSGNSLGNYTFQKGKWRPAYNFAPGQIIHIYSYNGSVPEGFKKVDSANAALPEVVANGIAASNIKNDLGVDVYFAVTYVGF